MTNQVISGKGADGKQEPIRTIGGGLSVASHNTNTTPTVLTLSGGNHQYMSITGGKNYRVVSDVDIWAKSSTANSNYGAEMTKNTDGYNTGFTDWTGNTEVTVLTSSSDAATFEFWSQKATTTATANNDVLMAMGNSSAAEINVIFTPSSGVWFYQFKLVDDTNTNVLNKTGTTTVSSDTDLHHIVFVADRSADTLTVYLDGAILEHTASVGFTAGTCTFDTTNMAMKFGLTIGNAANGDGHLLDFKMYQSALTQAQVQARTNAGPVTAAANLVRDTPTSVDPAVWFNFQDFDTWADATQPEPVSGYGTVADLTMDSLVGSPAITVYGGGDAATTTTASPILAGDATIITTAETDAFLNVYSKPGATGTVWVTEV